MHATTHKHSPSSATPVTPLPAGAESADALGGFSPPQGGSENRGSGGLPRLRGGSGWPLQGGPRGLRPRPATPENPPRPPASGGPKIGEISDFLPPSGAKSWGSGGAPPTNLILLRNQRARLRVSRAPQRTSGPARHPAPPPTQPPRAPWWVVVWCGWGWGLVGLLRLGPPEARRGSQSGAQRREGSTPSTLAPTASSLRSSARAIRCGWTLLSLPSTDRVGPSTGRYRSSAVEFPRLWHWSTLL